ncbi:hypothetical protein M1771_00390 [Spiroplasma citri]|uniref:hypothetical protein n=1 Tax=Spiroplasma citri TaxID=2133 RepID=UPI002412B2E6|nr:hypothetical protein [Spiroplasma citri]WFH00405.1 hypothetical protein M1771_00390 [Spiroplasma citri]
MFIFGFQWKLWIKLLSSSIMILISLPLIITNKKTNLKVQYLYYKINFLFSYKKYSKNKTILLVPYNKVIDDNYIATHGILKGTF